MVFSFFEFGFLFKGLFNGGSLIYIRYHDRKWDKENPNKKKPFEKYVEKIVIGLVHCNVKKVRIRTKINISL